MTVSVWFYDLHSIHSHLRSSWSGRPRCFGARYCVVLIVNSERPALAMVVVRVDFPVGDLVVGGFVERSSVVLLHD